MRPVYETNVLDVEKGSAFAYTLMIDGVTGAILHRQNQVENNNDVYPFQGEITALFAAAAALFAVLAAMLSMLWFNRIL